jgi:hypothetical protein
MLFEKQKEVLMDLKDYIILPDQWEMLISAIMINEMYEPTLKSEYAIGGIKFSATQVRKRKNDHYLSHVFVGDKYTWVSISTSYRNALTATGHVIVKRYCSFTSPETMSNGPGFLMRVRTNYLISELKMYHDINMANKTEAPVFSFDPASAGGDRTVSVSITKIDESNGTNTEGWALTRYTGTGEKEVDSSKKTSMKLKYYKELIDRNEMCEKTDLDKLQSDFYIPQFNVTMKGTTMPKRSIVSVHLLDNSEGILPQDSIVVNLGSHAFDGDTSKLQMRMLMDAKVGTKIREALTAHNNMRTSTVDLAIRSRTGNEVKLIPITIEELEWVLK